MRIRAHPSRASRREILQLWNKPAVGVEQFLRSIVTHPRVQHLQVRGVFENAKHALLPGYFVRVRVPARPRPALLVPEVAVGSDQAGRYVLTVNADNVVEQRRVQLGQTVGEMRVVESGLNNDERVVVSGILDAVPGQKVDPQVAPAKSAATEPGTNSPGAN